MYLHSVAHRRGPDNSVRVAITGQFSGVNNVNVFWAQLNTSSSIAQADLNTWTTSFQAAYKTRFAPYITNNYVFTQAQATAFTPGNSVLQATIAMSGNGTNGTSPVLDLSATKVVSWLTTVYWRGGKPRTYIPTCQTTDVADGKTLLTATRTAMATAAGNFRTDINALTSGTITGTTLGFVSFFTGNTLRPSPLFFAFTGAAVHTRLGSQRRRLGRWIA